MIELVLPADAGLSNRQEAVWLQLHGSSIFTMEHVIRDMRGVWDLFLNPTRPYPSRILRPPNPGHKGQTYVSPQDGKAGTAAGDKLSACTSALADAWLNELPCKCWTSFEPKVRIFKKIIIDRVEINSM